MRTLCRPSPFPYTRVTCSCGVACLDECAACLRLPSTLPAPCFLLLFEHPPPGAGAVAWEDLKFTACWVVDQLDGRVCTVPQLSGAIVSMSVSPAPLLLLGRRAGWLAWLLDWLFVCLLFHSLTLQRLYSIRLLRHTCAAVCKGLTASSRSGS